MSLKRQKLQDALELIDACEEDIKASGLVAGYVGLFDLPRDVLFVIDNELKDEDNLICGANEENYHLTGISLKDVANAKYDDLIVVQVGDKCTCCGGELTHTKGIEVGHIFQLGTKYSASMNANFLDRNGKAQPFIMGTYGIGVSRLISAVIEQHHDDKGMIWTKETAPFTVDIIVSNAKNEEEMNFANHLYDALHKFKIETILDDRIDARYGFKMGDFELIGFPYGVIVGKKLADGIVEIVDRQTLEKIEVQKHEVVAKLMELIG